MKNNKNRNFLSESRLLLEATSSEVMIVQKRLNECFKLNLVVDGICGINTKTAIEKYLQITVQEV